MVKDLDARLEFLREKQAEIKGKWLQTPVGEYEFSQKENELIDKVTDRVLKALEAGNMFDIPNVCVEADEFKDTTLKDVDILRLVERRGKYLFRLGIAERFWSQSFTITIEMW